MGRPRTSGDTFSFDDLAVAGGLTKSAVQHVAQASLMPRGDDDVCDIRTFKRVAVIGAFVAAGVPLMLAAQIAEAMILEFGSDDGEAPSGLNNLWRKLPHDEVSALPWRNDFGLHARLRRHPEIYSPGRAMDYDAVYEIADREFVFHRQLKSIGRVVDPFAPDGISESGLMTAGRIEGWQRGGKPLFAHFDDDGQPTAEARVLYDKMIAARENAVGVIVVNLSLAIRNGLDRLAEHRTAAEGSAKKR